MKKNIAHILAGKEKWITATEKVLQPLPHADFRFANPFIVLHHGGPNIIPAGSESRIHPHPHRGFSPVTFQLQGQSYHKDNAGHDEVIDAGDVQWMFAGKGILHSEGPSDRMHREGGTSEFLQLWVNAPAAHKWDEPLYQHVRSAEMPQILEGEGIDIRLASGSFDGKTGPVNISFTPVITAFGSIANGKEIELMVPEDYWTLLYVAHGMVTVDELTPVGSGNLVVFKREGTQFSLATNEDSRILFLCAAPIDEPVAAKDNFVMNTKEETEQAIADYKQGLFGTLDY